MRTILSSTLLYVVALFASGLVSTNVPLDHWSYNAVDKLVGCGLIDGAMMNTKPVSRIEMARHVAEAIDKSQQLQIANEVILAILERLKSEFAAELALIGAADAHFVDSFIKPVEDPYFRFVYAENEPNLENQRGDIFHSHSNYRLGFSSRMTFWDNIAFYLHPEYNNSASGTDGDVELVEGYSKIAIGRFEIQAGKDSLWWGPGHHGSMLMSNNTQPLKMLKIANPEPMELPWILRHLGPFKAVWFMAELEQNRTSPNTKMTGLRLNFKFRPNFEFGMSRTMLFGGPGVGLRDYLGVFIPQSEQAGSNQLAGFDVSLMLPLGQRAPVSSVRLYADLAGEDEAGYLPSKWGGLMGLQVSDILRTGRTDLRIEYANNHVPGSSNVFYTHGLYPYTYEGRVIGHHMGTDASDLFIQLSHYLTNDMLLDVTYDKAVQGLSSEPRQTTDQLGFDLTFFAEDKWRLSAGYRYESGPKDGQNPHDDNQILQFCLVRRF